MSASAAPPRHSCSIYGVRVTSDMPFDFPGEAGADQRSLAEVELVEGDARDFAPFDRDGADDCVRLPSGATYLRWPHLYEFSVSADGARVACRPLDGCDRSVLQNFLFGQILGVALVLQGFEPLHAAVVSLDGCAVAFLGDCTFGKSTLLASLVHAGWRAVTDDLLLLDRRSAEILALPGTGRIKLQPDAARRFFGGVDAGLPLNPMTAKRAFPLDPSRREAARLPLRALMILPEPDERDRARDIEIAPASRVELVHELLKNTFTVDILDRARLVRQLESAAVVASTVPGFRLRYPTGLQHLDDVRDAIVDHVRRAQGGRAA